MLTNTSGGIMCIGGPALVYYVTPSEEELFSVSPPSCHTQYEFQKPTIFQRYNPELQKRSLERRQEKQEDFDNFVGRLKEYSKSEKPSKSLLSNPRPRHQKNNQTNSSTVWAAWEKDVERRRAVHAAEQMQAKRAEDSASEALRNEIKGSIK
jgi:hypothetical protein